MNYSQAREVLDSCDWHGIYPIMTKLKSNLEVRDLIEYERENHGRTAVVKRLKQRLFQLEKEMLRKEIDDL